VTLRLRLLLLVVVIVVAGLAISDVVTYTSLRSFLTTRVDQELSAATFPVERALTSSSPIGPRPPESGSAASHATTTPGSSTHSGSALRGKVPGTGPGVLIPPGTYGEVLTATGKVKAHVFFTYGGKAPAVPVIPSSLPGSGGKGTTARYFSTSSMGANGAAYRAVARPLPNGAGTIVVAEPLTDLQSTLGRLLLIETVLSLLLLAVLGVISWIMVRRDMRPLDEMAETAGAIAEGDLSQRVSYVTPGTEVGELGLAFNTMLGRIEEAFAARAASEERLRRFLADASHELRTPLTSILGYAELFDLGVRDRPADLATSMHYIKNEAARMGTLVDDLFLLAQLDRERPLHRESVDLAEVVRESVTGFGVAAPQRRVVMDVSGPVTVVGDRHRLRQVVDNLVGNAVSHTPDGVSIRVSARTEAGQAVLTVHDDGPGISPEDVGRIFEPFFRSDPSRARATGGAGLGLAIVSAIVVAHGGTVRFIPGDGTTFEVRMEAAAFGANGSLPPPTGDLVIDGDKDTALRGERAPRNRLGSDHTP
jgi:two-component system, OmpR family, sensor kinase